MPSRAAISAIPGIGSIDVVEVVPIVPTIAIGLTPIFLSEAIACSRASSLSSNRSFVGIFVRPFWPRPSVMQAFSIEEWASAEA
jgi:hypothetical protein